MIGDLEDVAIALTSDDRAPHLVVHRSGHFRTVLAAGMQVTDAHTLTYQQFQGQLERMDDLRERFVEAEKHSGAEGGAAKLVERLTRGGCYLSREEFVAISHWQPLLRDYFVASFGELARTLEQRRLFIRRVPPKKLGPEADSFLYEYWKSYYLVGHLGLLGVMDRHRHAEPLSIAPERLFRYFSTPLFRQGTIGSALKAGWVTGELGKDVLSTAKQLYARPGGHWEIIEGVVSLLAIAARRPKTHAEITKVLDTPLRGAAASDYVMLDIMLRFVRQVFAALANPDAGEEQLWTASAASALQRMQLRPTEEAKSVELGVAAATQSALSLRDEEAIKLLFVGTPRVAKAEPKNLYFPESVLGSIRRDWQPSDTLSLLAIQESFLEKPQPARAIVTPGRNDPCSCGSGKKYKKCCGG